MTEEFKLLTLKSEDNLEGFKMFAHNVFLKVVF